MHFDMGPDAGSDGVVTAFEPNRRIAYDEDWATLLGHSGADVTPLATEFLVEARSGGTCVVRVVSSAYGTGADWEHEFWSEMESGWAPMLDNLRIYLTHFPGQAATTLTVTAPFSGELDGAFHRMRDALGVGAVGDRVTALGVDGVVERCWPRIGPEQLPARASSARCRVSCRASRSVPPRRLSQCNCRQVPLRPGGRARPNSSSHSGRRSSTTSPMTLR